MNAPNEDAHAQSLPLAQANAAGQVLTGCVPARCRGSAWGMGADRGEEGQGALERRPSLGSCAHRLSTWGLGPLLSSPVPTSESLGKLVNDTRS